MTQLLVKNAKIAKSNNNQFTVYNFGIPAYRSQSGFITCPMAGTCGKTGGCYAMQGAYIWTPVKAAYEYRLEMSFKPDFAHAVALELEPKAKTALRVNKMLVIRIHDSGDFYNAEYLDKWLEVINKYPNIKFYAYTKMLPLFRAYKKKGLIPNNFTIIFSEGGIKDNNINRETERHSRVFESLEQLKAAGYEDCTENDLNIFNSLKCGLVYHGHAKYKWNTNAA